MLKRVVRHETAEGTGGSWKLFLECGHTKIDKKRANIVEVGKRLYGRVAVDRHKPPPKMSRCEECSRRAEEEGEEGEE